MESPKRGKKSKKRSGKKINIAIKKAIDGLKSVSKYPEEDPEAENEGGEEGDESQDDEQDEDYDEQDEDYDEQDEDYDEPDEDEEGEEPQDDEQDEDYDEPDEDKNGDESRDEQKSEEQKEEKQREEKRSEKDDEPGKKREEPKEPENPIQEPKAETGAKAGGKGAAKVGAETGAKTAATGAEGAATAGAEGAATAGTAAGTTAAAGAEAAGAAAAEGAAAAGTAAAATIEVWGPILLIIVAVVALIAAIAIGYGYFKNKIKGVDGSTPSITVNANDPDTVKTISDLAALAGDSDSRRQVATSAIEGLDDLLIKAEKNADKSPLKDKIINAVNLSQQAIKEIEVGRAGTTSNNSALDEAINKLFLNLDRVVGLYYGVDIKSPKDIADRAKKTVEETGVATSPTQWIFTTNNEPDSATEPLRNGTNIVAGKRGCDAGGFGSFVLTRKPQDIDGKICTTCVTPGYDQFDTFYNFVLTSKEVSEAPDVKDFVPGDILITSKQQGDKKDRDLFVVVGDLNNDGVREAAHCSANAPLGPQNVGVNFITQNKLNIDKILRYKYAQQ